MNRAIIMSSLLLMVVLCLGCGGEGKKDDKSGPRITGGGPVDNSAGPVKPSVGGEVKPGK